MARSTELLTVLVPLISIFALSGCGDLSKGDALAVVQRDVKEDANCTLPINVLSSLKTQYTTKAMCVPKETNPANDHAGACVNAMIGAGVMKKMPVSYMLEWPDEVANTALDTLSAYDRKARDQMFRTCVEMTPELREGRFRCGEAKAEKVVKITKSEPPTPTKRVTVRYTRTVTLDPQLASLDSACSGITQPAPEGSVTMEKIESRWAVVPSDSPATPGSAR